MVNVQPLIYFMTIEPVIALLFWSPDFWQMFEKYQEVLYWLLGRYRSVSNPPEDAHARLYW